jgi:predicted amidohydrolase
MNPPSADSSLRAAIYQYSVRDEAPERRLQRLREILRATPPGSFDLVVCPELFLSGYNVGASVAVLAQPSDGGFARAAAAIAKECGTALVYGYPEATADNPIFNAALCIGSDGRPRASHRKLRLPNDFERRWFAPGESYTILDIGGLRVALLVCYDVEFPEAVRACAMAGAEIVVAPTALKAEWAFVARQVVPTRAFENGVFLLYANYCGQENGFTYLGESCIIGPDGGEIARAGRGEELITGVLGRSQIAQARARLPYLSDRAGLDSTAVRPAPRS